MKNLLACMAILAAVVTATSAAWSDDRIAVYKSVGCGCCEKWVDYLRSEGFEVTAENRSDLSSVKRKLGVKPEFQSCHTAVVDGYVIEGHVPASAIRQLLAERPDTRGLAVPGMPSNSPGMGRMDGTLTTYTLEGAAYSRD